MIGTGREPMSGLAAGLSAAEDREFLAQVSLQQFGYTPSFEVSVSGQLAPSNSGPMLEALHCFAPGLCGFDEALDVEDGIDESLIDEDDPIFREIMAAGGTPWPTPWTEPDDWSVSEALGGFNAFCAKGQNDGVFGDALQGLDVAPGPNGRNVKLDAMKLALTAAFQPGTQLNKDVVAKLLKKQIELAEVAEKRALVTKRARDQFEANLRRIANADKEIARLYNLSFDVNGKVKKGATDEGVKKLLELRKKAIELGRETVRLQKLNMLATAITQNTLTQITSVQTLAQAVATGAPKAVPALVLAFDKLGRENVKIRETRQKQIEAWKTGGSVKKARELAGLEGFDGLHGLDAVERPFDELEQGLAALEWSFRKAVKKAARKVGGTFKKAAEKVGDVAEEVGETGGKLVKTTVLAPARGTINAAKRIAHGDVKGAFKSVGMIVVDQAKGLKDFAATTFLKWPCDIANTGAFKTAVKVVGQAAGSAVGTLVGQPTLGGAVGKEAGGQAANTQRNTCGAMKTIGLTDGSFRPGKIDDAAKAFAKRAWRETLSPQAQLRSLKNIAMDYATGGFATGASSFNVGGVNVLQKVGLDPKKLLSSNPVIQNIAGQGVAKLSSGVYGGAGKLLAKSGVPGAKQLTPELVKALQTGKVSIPSINASDLARQGASLASREALKFAKQKAAGVAVRSMPKAVAKLQVGVSATPSQLKRVAAQLSPATVEKATYSRPVSKFLSQATDAAAPYVGSIGTYI